MPHTSHSRHPTTAEAVEEIVVCRSALLSPAAYQFYRAILLTFAECGDAPDPAALRQLATRFGVPFQATLSSMATQDLVQRDPSTGRIRAAYPFSGVPTPHRVTLFADQSAEPNGHRDIQVFAMCALDALGIPLMLGRGAEIVSQDALSGELIRVVMRPTGDLTSDLTRRSRLLPFDHWSATWEPPEAVVLARPEEHEAEHDAGVCVAAGSCCPVTNFFARAANADAWASQRQAAVDGIALAQHEALTRAYALFAGVLDRDVLVNRTSMATHSEREGKGEGDSMTQTIEVLYVTGCPHVEPTVALLRDVLRAKGLDAMPINRILIETMAEAERQDFHGSPTVRINGRDVASPPPGEAPSLACRLYRDSEGHLTPHPTVDALVAALELS